MLGPVPGPASAPANLPSFAPTGSARPVELSRPEPLAAVLAPALAVEAPGDTAELALTSGDDRLAVTYDGSSRCRSPRAAAPGATGAVAPAAPVARSAGSG